MKNIWTVIFVVSLWTAALLTLIFGGDAQSDPVATSVTRVDNLEASGYVQATGAVSGDTVTVTTGTGQAALISTKRAASTDGVNVCIGGGCQSVAYDGSHSYTGSTNTALGIDALLALTSGYENTAIGRRAGTAVTSGFSNTMVGMVAGPAISSGAYNTCIGAQSCQALTTMVDNTVVGQLGLAALATAGGNGNTVIGVQAMLTSNHTNARQNVAIGLNAYLNGQAQNNVIIGYEADHGAANTGNSSVILGAFASGAHVSGNQNVLIGETVAQDLTTGGTNTMLGRRTGFGITTGSNNTILGANIQGLATGLANTIIIADGTGTASHQIWMQPAPPTSVNHGSLGTGSSNTVGNVTGIGANTSVVLTFSTAFPNRSWCQATPNATGQVIFVTNSASAPTFSCIDMAGSAANCVDFTYWCTGQ